MRSSLSTGFIILSLSVSAAVFGQSASTQSASAQSAPYQRLAPINLTGNWVSVITEDWAVRMLPPVKGDFASLPLNAAGQKAANAWDPARDLAAGDACKAYAAPALLRIPGRLKINWQEGGNTLRIDTDAGQQTRFLHFRGAAADSAAADSAAADSAAADSQATLQGYSAATWNYAGGFDPARASAADGVQAVAARRGRGAPPTAPQGGSLQAVTTRLKPGYLRKNGVPFSKDAVLTEYFNVYADPYGTDWMVVTSIVHDPAYLVVDYITSTNFKREPDESKWHPRPCAAK